MVSIWCSTEKTGHPGFLNENRNVLYTHNASHFYTPLVSFVKIADGFWGQAVRVRVDTLKVFSQKASSTFQNATWNIIFIVKSKLTNIKCVTKLHILQTTLYILGQK